MVLSPFFHFFNIDNFASRVLLWRLVLPSGLYCFESLLPRSAFGSAFRASQARQGFASRKMQCTFGAVLPSGLFCSDLALTSGLRKLVEASLLERCNAPSGLVPPSGLYCLRGSKPRSAFGSCLMSPAKAYRVESNVTTKYSLLVFALAN